MPYRHKGCCSVEVRGYGHTVSRKLWFLGISKTHSSLTYIVDTYTYLSVYKNTCDGLGGRVGVLERN
jgi:hypothetical protein